MKIFSVLVENSKKNIVFIEEKFSPLALIFQGFWLLYYKMWLHAGVYFSFKSLIYFALHSNLISQRLAIEFEIIIALTVGLFAKTWYIEKLKKENFQLQLVIVAPDKDQAKFRFYQNSTDTIYV